MELTYFGHSCYALTSGGKTVAIDPFNDDIGHRKPQLAPDAVTVSHEHFDHNNIPLCQGLPAVIRGLTAEGKDWAAVDTHVGGIHITAVGSTYHDDQQGKARGKNSIMIFEAEGLRVVHLGDLGHLLSDREIRAIGVPDVLMIPVGGHFTIGPAEADRVIAQLKPRVIIPMHFKTKVNESWPIGTVDDYLKGRPAKRLAAKVVITKAGLPETQETWALVPL